MATPYSVIDNLFLSKITDTSLLTMPEEHLRKILDQYRFSANVKFKVCKKLLDRNEELRQYNQDLTDEEIEILVNYMVLEWLTPQVNAIRNLEPVMTTKDYKVYSNAQHLETLLKMKQDIARNVDQLMVSYTYSENNLDALGSDDNG